MFNEFKSVTRRPAYRSEAEVKSDRLGAIFFELVNKKKKYPGTKYSRSTKTWTKKRPWETRWYFTPTWKHGLFWTVSAWTLTAWLHLKRLYSDKIRSTFPRACRAPFVRWLCCVCLTCFNKTVSPAHLLWTMSHWFDTGTIWNKGGR